MWGQAQYCFAVAHGHRIIPMRVGTRFGNMRNAKREQDHPHACGDKSLKRRIQTTRLGSSPCVWGQVCDKFYVVLNKRIIPMRVGTRALKDVFKQRAWDHPHACGDKLTISIVTPATFGIIPMRVGTRLKKSRKIAVLQNQPLRFPLTFHRSFV